MDEPKEKQQITGVIQSITRKRDGLKIDDVYYNCYPNDSRIKDVGIGDEVAIEYENQPRRNGGFFRTIITVLSI